MVAAYLVLVALVGCERLYELYLSRQHAAAAFARGGIEYGQGHFGFMCTLHAAWLLGCLLEPLYWPRESSMIEMSLWATLFVAAEALRYWCIFSLGEQWNTRVIVVPNASAVTRGPYRWLRHPNYVAVILEGFAFPLLGGALATAALFSVLNVFLLRVRIQTEEQAMQRMLTNYQDVGVSA